MDIAFHQELICQANDKTISKQTAISISCGLKLRRSKQLVYCLYVSHPNAFLKYQSSVLLRFRKNTQLPLMLFKQNLITPSLRHMLDSKNINNQHNFMSSYRRTEPCFCSKDLPVNYKDKVFKLWEPIPSTLTRDLDALLKNQCLKTLKTILRIFN